MGKFKAKFFAEMAGTAALGGIHPTNGIGKKKKMKNHGGAAAREARAATQTTVVAAAAPKANPLSRTSSTTRAHLSTASFSSLPFSAPTARALAEVLRYERMTLVQEATLPVALKGHDVIAKAKTGTG